MIFNASVWFISFTYLHRTIFNLSDNLYLAIYSTNARGLSVLHVERKRSIIPVKFSLLNVSKGNLCFFGRIYDILNGKITFFFRPTFVRGRASS